MAFGAEIATAFVRIRPNMVGFKAETESGVRSAFSGIAKIAGIALGAGAAFEFGKSIISDAASVQKSVETVNAEFGRSGRLIHAFANNAGLAFGIASHASEGTAARFGILFKNLGIGKTESAGMTVGLLKLAGSLSAIRGVDPSSVLERLPLALAGNLRSLKQLGLAVDSSQIKIAAFKLGLISSVKDAITPAIKAQAIYALATARLPGFLDQAKKHSGDLVNVQRRLSAEWDHAKEALGKALLPQVTKALTAFQRWFSSMQKSGKLQADFNAIARTTSTVVRNVAEAFRIAKSVLDPLLGAVGGVRGAFIALFTILSVNKIRSIAASIVTSLVNNGLDVLRVTTAEARTEYVAAFGTMDIATVGLGATIKSALITTGIGALVVAIGLAVAFVITHWSLVKKYTIATADAIAATWQGLKTTLIGIAELIGGSMTTYLTAPFRALLKAAGFLGGIFDSVFGTHISSGLKKAQGYLDAFTTDLATRGKNNVIGGFKEMASGATKAFNDALAKKTGDPKVIAGLRKSGTDLGKTITKATADTAAAGAAGVTKAVSGAMQTALDAAQKRIAQSVADAKKNLDSIGQKLADSVDKILAKIGGSVGGTAAPVTVAYQKLLGLLKGGGATPDVARAAAALANQVSQTGGKTQKQILQDQFHNITSEFNRGKISLRTFNREVTDLLKRDHVSYATAGKVLGSSFRDGFEAQVKGIRAQAAALNAVPAKFRQIGGAGGDIKIIHPLNVIQTEQTRIGSLAARQRERQIKASERAATAAEKSLALQRAERGTKVAPLPGVSPKKNAKAAANRHGG